MTPPTVATVSASEYWERRAARYAGVGAGLRAVCSYGMPGFYNRAIELTQHIAMRPWRSVAPGTRVLDVGCGIGRWSRMVAANGAQVTGVDLSPTMVTEARRRAQASGLEGQCRFEVGDATDLSGFGTFDLVICVTVLQHILSDEDRRRAVEGFADALRPGGKALILEAAPTTNWRASDHPQFRPRTLSEHVELFRSSGLNLLAVTGVDSTAVRKYFLPAYGRLPSAIGMPLLALGTVLALPLDVALARFAPRWSWHKLFVLRRDS